MEVEAFEYGGKTVRGTKEFLNLTDMWKAAGAPPRKAPAMWQALPQAIDFVAYIAENMGKSDVLAISAKRGRGGGTWAHWQIGLAYAKYLSPEFHAWCNTVVRQRMEGRLVPADGPAASNVLATLTEEQQKALGPVVHFMEQAFARTFSEHHDLRQLVSRVSAQVEELQAKLPQRRREIGAATRERLIAVLVQLGCRCPCCGMSEVVSKEGAVINGAEFDHYYANQLASDEHSWLVCKTCHDALTFERMPRERATPHFMSFQIRRARLQSPEGNPIA